MSQPIGRGNRQIALPSLQIHRTEPIGKSRMQVPFQGLRPRPSGFINAFAASEFPHCGKGTDRPASRFAPKRIGIGMAEHRKSTSSRNIAGRGTVREKTAKTTGRTPAKRWSQRVTRESNALDLEQGVFTLRDPRRIAASLKRSAERSSRRKAGAYRSALSMLTFYINRAGRSLPKTQRRATGAGQDRAEAAVRAGQGHRHSPRKRLALRARLKRANPECPVKPRGYWP